MKMKSIISLTLVIFSVFSVYAQEAESIKIKFKSGVNYDLVSEQFIQHLGGSINAGLEFKTRNDRIYYNPNVTFGLLKEGENMASSLPSPGTNYLFPILIESNLYIDIFKTTNNFFALTIGLGAYGNIILGDKTTSSLGGYIGTGINLTPPDSKYSIEILPLNFRKGLGSTEFFFTRISIKYILVYSKTKHNMQ